MNTSRKRSWLVHWTARRAAHAPFTRKPAKTHPVSAGQPRPRQTKHERMIGTLIILAVLAVFALLVWHAASSSPIPLPDSDYYYWLP